MESGVFPRRAGGDAAVTEAPEHKAAVNSWRAVRLFFCASFGAIFGMACALPASDPSMLVCGVLGALVGLVIHIYSERFLQGIIKILRDW